MVGIPINLLEGVLTWCNRRDANPTLIDPATWPSYAIADEIEGRLRVQATDVHITDRIGGPAPAERSDLHQRIRRFIVQMDLHSSGRGGAQPEVIPSLDHIRNIAQVFGHCQGIGDAVAVQGGRVGASDHTPEGIDGDTAERAHTDPTAARDHFKLQTGGAQLNRGISDQLPEAVAVTQLGAMLQVQIKSAGSADEAANNLKNWIAKIGSGETVKGYADAGIDYQGSMNAAIGKGLSTFEASFELARRYVEKTDPKKAKQLDQGLTKISQETDPAKVQAMADALAATLRTGDVFADMQVKTALMAYTQNKKLYADLKRDAADPNGQRKDILDKNLSERREASSQRWAETGQAFNDSLRAIGDALRPAADALATGIGAAARGLTALSEETPKAVLGLAALTAGALVLGKAWAALKIGRGLVNIARGSAGDRSNIVQRVFVTNAKDGDDDEPDRDPARRVRAFSCLRCRHATTFPHRRRRCRHHHLDQ